MRSLASFALVWVFADAACAINLCATEGKVDPSGAVIAYQLPAPEVRFVSKFDETKFAVTTTTSFGLGPFPVPPYTDNNRYEIMEVSTALGSTKATYSRGAHPERTYFKDIEVSYTGIYNEDHYLDWEVITALGPDMVTFLADATNVSSTSVTKQDSVTGLTYVWKLSNPLPSPRTETNNTSTPGSIDWEEVTPSAFFYSIGAGKSRRQNCRYKVVASPALIGTKVFWFEVFTPIDGSVGRYKPMEWTIAGKESQPFTLSAPAEGNVAVEFYSAELAVDADRDGSIKLASEDASDATTAEKPHRFWLNDDDDTEGTLMMDGLSGPPFDEADKVPATVADYTKHKISSQRNLEDFARLWIDMTGLQSMVTTSGGIQVGLKWQNTTGTTPAINVYLSADPTGSDSYLKSDQAAFNQVGILVANNNAITFANNKQTIDTSDTFVFPADLLQTQLQKSPVLHLLFEGAGVGTGQLVLVLLDKNGAEIGVGSGVWFDLMNIKSMYERAVATTGGPRSENGVDYTIPLPHDLTGPDDNNTPHPSMGWAPNPLGYPYEPDPAEIKTYIVYVHGWRWSPEKANNRTETVFKRLWHLGYKGRLAALRWPTFYGGSDDGDDNLPGDLGGVFTYNDSEYRAWKSGESLKLYVNQLTSGYARYVVAHSMGNIVAGSALKSGMSVAKYVMLNAAVPAMCYDENTSLRQADWNYTTPNTDADAGTRALGYIGQLGTLNTNVVNFFLSNDSATLDMWNINNNVWRPQRYNLRTTGYAYDPAEIAGRRLYITFFASFGRYLIDPHEAMPYACQSLTRTAGADGRTRGSIQSTVDMDASFGFGTSHGAEWDRNYQATRAFYQQLLITLNSAP